MTDKRDHDERLRGMRLLHHPRWNHGTGFTGEERDELGLRGLLPPRVQDIETQVARVLENLRRKGDDLERYIGLVALQDRNETLFYRVLVDHLPEMMPLIYTPTVGEACQKFGHIFRRPRGLYVTARDRGRIAEVLANWPYEARMIVVTDGERILGLGDLGADGMGIPIGKLAIYTAAAGIEPQTCLPIMFDVGTEDRARHDDLLYMGLPQPRLRGAEYDSLFAELIEALGERYPEAVIQMEDFARGNAFRLLREYREKTCLFNDDIQGTGCVVAAGLLSALKVVDRPLEDARILFVGAGEASIGTGDTVVGLLHQRGLLLGEARERCWFFDSTGLVVEDRDDLDDEKLGYAHPLEFTDDLVDAIETLRPRALIGASGVPGVFTREVVEKMAAVNERPIVFALSNPTSKAECTAEQAYEWSDGRAIFASGSPFAPVDVGRETRVPGQANNAYVFPGIGLGLIASRARHVTDDVFLAAAETLAETTTPADLETGRVFPPLERIREISARVASVVARNVVDNGLARCDPDVELDERVRELMWYPDYEEERQATR